MNKNKYVKAVSINQLHWYLGSTLDTNAEVEVLLIPTGIFHNNGMQGIITISTTVKGDLNLLVYYIF